jgi:hypothetical protein
MVQNGVRGRREGLRRTTSQRSRQDEALQAHHGAGPGRRTPIGTARGASFGTDDPDNPCSEASRSLPYTCPTGRALCHGARVFPPPGASTLDREAGGDRACGMEPGHRQEGPEATRWRAKSAGGAINPNAATLRVVAPKGGCPAFPSSQPFRAARRPVAAVPVRVPLCVAVWCRRAACALPLDQRATDYRREAAKRRKPGERGRATKPDSPKHQLRRHEREKTAHNW